MKRLAVAVLIVAVVSCLEAVEESHHNQLAVDHMLHRNINAQCCAMLGGALCGTTFPNCCTGGCRPTWYGGTGCIGQKIKMSPDLCPNSCKNVCGQQGGVICGTTINREDCCLPHLCRGLIHRSCTGFRIPLFNCVPHTTFSKWSWE